MLCKKIAIGDQEFLMSAAASVNVVYQNIFNEDFIASLDRENLERAGMQFQKMAFVMAKVGELGRKEANTLTVEDYEDWLDNFTFADMMNAIEDIQDFYLSSSAETIGSKKK